VRWGEKGEKKQYIEGREMTGPHEGTRIWRRKKYANEHKETLMG